ncbi:efflux RND transporter periplasmic adaptor subunit [Rugamonas sp. CCM 8940]|uniref:efflux RND transporter periplasmic adaptor subunit n=1 Tax=Rugamonas sp. CCM 8940 TaxID=2765359 RepID=UPI0018F38B05|nr:efflux RND transporter periplasmic adaptor subunit [Rugamonas sp. CCM 8940]MBJ7312984.1 efflux RND transporter periplasmic adaptor subunit [Rugamonas sp. CCM 8940]
MKHAPTPKHIVLALLAAGLVYGGYWAGARQHADMPNTSPGTAPAGADTQASPARKVLYWHDPMVPGQKFDKPGQSPFMDMELVPVYADDAGTGSGVQVSPALRQNLGIRMATVRRADVRDTLELVGTTQFDESRAEVVQSRVTGYVERLHARAPLQRVKRGQPIATLFVPDWIAPQEEYLALKRAGDTALMAAARQRMRVLSIPDALLSEAERSGKAQTRLTLSAPADGVITELGVRDGAMVSPGATIAKISGLNTVWLLAEVPEALLGAARVGMTVTASVAGAPQRSYTGHVREMLPGVGTATRTAQARLELDNRDGSLTPGMLMQVRLEGRQTVSRLLVPAEAVLSSGKRSVVLVAGEGNGIRPVTVGLGRERGDDIEIVSGLEEGQKVVASGQFLIDSEANLKSILPKFDVPAEHAEHAAHGAKR